MRAAQPTQFQPLTQHGILLMARTGHHLVANNVERFWNKLPRFWSATKNYSPKLNQKTLQNELLKPATTLMM
jgi:hypothetical protein